MSNEIPIAPTNETSTTLPTTTTRGDVVGGEIVLYLSLNSLGQESQGRALLISTSQFELCAETGVVDEEFEEEYSFSEDNNTSNNFDSDFEEYVLDDTDPIKTRPASKTAIEGLEKVKIVDEEVLGKVGSLRCSVCLEELSMETEARRLPCSHVYHAACIIQWLNNSNMCPLCRYKLPVVDFDLNFNDACG